MQLCADAVSEAYCTSCKKSKPIDKFKYSERKNGNQWNKTCEHCCGRKRKSYHDEKSKA